MPALLRRRSLSGLAVGLAAGLLGLALSAVGLLEGWENLTWDLRVRLLARPGPTTPRVTLFVLDQASLTWAKEEFALGWPWPRQVYEPLLGLAKRVGAAAFGGDVIFSEPSPVAGDDALLAQALAAGPPFVGAVVLGRTEEGRRDWPPELAAKLPDQAGLAALSQTPDPAVSVLLPIPELAQAATLLANVGENVGADQVVRRVSLLRSFAGRVVPSLSLAAYLAGTGESPALAPRRGGWWLRLGERSIPLDRAGRAILNYRGPPGTHPKFSAAAAIQTELRLREGRPPTLPDLDRLRDGFILFGFTAPGLFDLRSAPVAAVYPGVEVHATALDNLLAGDFLAPAPTWAASLALLALALLAGFLGTVGAKTHHSLLAFGLCLPLPAILSLAAYRLGWWWPVAGPGLSVAVALVGTVFVNYAQEGRQRRFIKRAFRHYLSPAVIDQLLADPDRLKLGGERRELTIYFSDLAGFTTLSEKLDPVELTSLLNDYLTEMTDIILEEGGTLDKYEGDAVIAFWNAPADQPDHALRGVRAALRCQARLRERQADFARRAGRPLAARIGLNTGPVVVGNMGSSKRFDYTVLGDAANLASRLEGANKVFGTPIMISETTMAQAQGGIIARELGALRVVGRRAPVRVFEPLALSGQRLEPPPSLDDGLVLCRAGRWAEALAFFQALGDDPPARSYTARLAELQSQPPQAWDGVWNLASK